ncbi:aminotransferase class I/II-fold pyridoxal phosphate-dependent enzyme [Stackebrandtia nassauensis]|uniref:Selenocysteine synthase (Seryl-tRNASer selenium transferase)-like protein n=1 Tax=Stackebrandtia nassauensis (strain DSM 44728 / CIP 108903 / NRRL B-16338 / NBRC 102104 / LLR-40K-21) TaxID=446470 RepID=D3PU83_STANL|nr:aminotransferase class I/II-fold pyridoxal phosphate-dependent enzyme [Stackebrandtia nassauensis]ADD41029.1 Selenocysteine synthase (seryl-tRNASer selenium transferase)-like protein [Stackebrandtia nassauensis DSM 44728]
MTATDGLPYAAGTILTDTQAHLSKLSQAWRHIRDRRSSGQPLHNLSGLERGLPMPADTDPWLLDDEWSGALYSEQVRDLGLTHLGGDPHRHDIVVTNRLTAALYAAMQVTVTPGSTVIAVSPSHSHPAVIRAVRDAGGELIETVGAEAFASTLHAHPCPSVVVMTRLAVTYDALPTEDLRRITDLAHSRGALVIVDDAGGARVGPAILGQPRTLELGADLGATGLDKYGVTGPRVGLLGGRTDLVARARARAFELGSECRPVLYPAVANCLSEYRPQRVVDLVASTHHVGAALRSHFGDWVEETPFITRLPGEAILTELARRNPNPIALAPIEATAAVAMCLLRDHGFLTVHFAGLPPGTSALLIKFLPPETIAAIGGAEAFVAALDDAFEKAAAVAHDESSVRALLHGTAG